MESKRILALDVSTKTGWALLISDDSGCHLEAYGQIPQIPVPDAPYPGSYVDWAYECFNEVSRLVDEHTPDILVIEETASGSKSIYSQKILEYIHFLIAKMIKEYHLNTYYLMTEQWRREVGCLMSKEESKHNKEVKKYKEKNSTKIAYDINGKRVGKITRKHVNIRRANEVFGKFLKEPLRKKDEDAADSLLLGYAHHLRRIKQ